MLPYHVSERRGFSSPPNNMINLSVRSHGRPKSLEVNPCNLNRPLREWQLALNNFTRSQVLSLKYDMDAYMTTFFGVEACDLR